MSLLTAVTGHARIRTVGSFDELVATSFAGNINALCWPRSLPGDFNEIATRLGAGEGIIPLDEKRLTGLTLSPAGRTARDVMLGDLRLLHAHGLAPELNCIHNYPRDDAAATVPTDVYSFHADRSPVEAATWLCTYHGPASEGLCNEEALRRVDAPSTRAALLKEYGGVDEGGFREFLSENSYDLHYTPLPPARPYSFGLGHLWRIAVDWPGSPVPPCLHRAPAQHPGQPRLILIC